MKRLVILLILLLSTPAFAGPEIFLGIPHDFIITDTFHGSNGSAPNSALWTAIQQTGVSSFSNEIQSNTLQEAMYVQTGAGTVWSGIRSTSFPYAIGRSIEVRVTPYDTVNTVFTAVIIGDAARAPTGGSNFNNFIYAFFQGSTTGPLNIASCNIDDAVCTNQTTIASTTATTSTLKIVITSSTTIQVYLDGVDKGSITTNTVWGSDMFVALVQYTNDSNSENLGTTTVTFNSAKVW